MKIKPNRLLLALFGVLMIVVTKKTYAATPIIHVIAKPSWILPCKAYSKKPLARDIENGAYNELIEEQVNVEKQATYNHFIIQIVSETGVQNNSEISVSFEPSFERLDFHEITIWRNNKPQARLNAAGFKMLAQENELEKFIYNGTYSAKYILGDIRKGDRIEYSYTITGFNPIFNNKFCRSIYLQGADFIMHQYTTLLFSSARKINIKPFNLISQPKISITGNLKRYEWEDFQVPAASENKFQPAWVNKYARVQVSDYSNWADVINWALKINPIQTNFSGELADTIARLKNRAGTDKEKYFRAAVTFVQDEIRYMGIETGVYSHRANSPGKVFNQRFGDCKDKSLLLASMLNADGIEAHMVLVNTDLEDKIENFTPSATLFNHAVVVATVNGKQIWVDATIANQRGTGTNLYFPPYKEGLILKEGNTGLTKIKETKTGKIVCEEKYSIPDEYSPVSFKVTTTYTLNKADDIRDQIASAGIAKTEKDYLEYYAKTYNSITASDSIIIKDNEEKNELTTIENYTIKNFFKRDSINGKYTADFYASFISRQLPDVTQQINTPVAVTYPYAIDYTIKAILPYGWDIENSHFAINRDSYNFSFDKTASGDVLSLRYQFAYLKDFISPGNLSQFNDDVKNLKDDKLSYEFFYIPDIKKVPFKLNALMLIITIIITAVFIYGGIKVYKNETSLSANYYKNNAFLLPLGGWLIVLIIALFANALVRINNLFVENFYNVSTWDLVTTGVKSVLNRALLIFEMGGNIILICFSIFCLVLVFNKRDISPGYIKGYYFSTVTYLFIRYFFDALVNGQFSSHQVQQIVEQVIVAAIWTYYLNVSTRVKQTFIVPYPY